MNKQEEKQIVSIDAFDSEVSLWQLLTSGVGRGLKRLKLIVDSIHNSQVRQTNKPLSILIVGKQGLRTHGRAFLRALCYGYPQEIPSQLFQTTTFDMYSFFSPTNFCDSYIISSISLLYPPALKIIYDIVSTGEYTIHDNVRKTTEKVPVFKPLIFTTQNKSKVPNYLKNKFDHIIDLEDYSEQTLRLIVLQRIKYCQMDMTEEKVLELIVAYGQNDLHSIIRLLKNAITITLAEGRRIVSVEDVQKVMSLS